MTESSWRSNIAEQTPRYANNFKGRRGSVVLVLILVVSFLLVLTIGWKHRIDSTIYRINDRHQLMSNVSFNAFKREALEVGLHASELRNSFIIKRFLLDRTSGHKRDVNSLLENVVAAHSTYKYLHIVDNKGIEILGVGSESDSVMSEVYSHYQNYNHRLYHPSSVELQNNQFWITPARPRDHDGGVILDANPEYQLITPLLVSEQRFGYLVYHVDATSLFNKARVALLGDLEKSELEIYNNSGVWSARSDSTKWSWKPLPNDSKLRQRFGSGVEQPLPVKTLNGQMQFVDLYGGSVSPKSDISIFDQLSFREGQELKMSINKVTPMVLKADYASLLSSIQLSKSDRLSDLIQTFVAAIICAGFVNWLWLRVLAWLANRAERRQELLDAANRDFLTNVMTRKAFTDDVVPHFSELSPLSGVGTILMVDIDDFKGVNDKYGHLKGDAVLKRIASSLLSQLRDNDRVARWGGDEFVIFLTSARADQVHSVAERIRVGLFAIQHDVGASSGIRVPVSIGVKVPNGGALIDSIEEADKALLKAKQNGGNQVVMVSDEDA